MSPPPLPHRTGPIGSEAVRALRVIRSLLDTEPRAQARIMSSASSSELSNGHPVSLHTLPKGC